MEYSTGRPALPFETRTEDLDSKITSRIKDPDSKITGRVLDLDFGDAPHDGMGHPKLFSSACAVDIISSPLTKRWR